MRHTFLILILLTGCTSESVPLIAERLARGDMLGRQWLEHDLATRQAVALEERQWAIATAKQDSILTKEVFVSEFQDLSRALREYECTDKRQEFCDKDEADLSEQMAYLCEKMDANDCSVAGISSAGDAFAERQLRHRIELYNCTAQIDTLDKAARQNTGGWFVLIALQTCGCQVPNDAGLSTCWPTPHLKAP